MVHPLDKVVVSVNFIERTKGGVYCGVDIASPSFGSFSIVLRFEPAPSPDIQPVQGANVLMLFEDGPELQRLVIQNCVQEIRQHAPGFFDS